MITEHVGEVRQKDELTLLELYPLLIKNYRKVLLMKYLCIIDYQIISKILNEKLLSNEVLISFKDLYKIDQLFLTTFSKVLDIELFYVNSGKFNTITSTSDFYAICFEFNFNEEFCQSRKRVFDILRGANYGSDFRIEFPVLFACN